MATALPIVDSQGLPTRARPRRLPDGRLLRSKVAWYWEAGAGALAAEILGDNEVQVLKGQMAVGALWSLALARQLEQGDAVAIGDETGTCLLGSLDPSWASEVGAIGIRWGRVVQRSCTPTPVVGEPLDVVTDTRHPSPLAVDADDDARRGDTVTVYLTDDEVLSANENPWLTTVLFPCRLDWRYHGGPIEVVRQAGTAPYAFAHGGARVTHRDLKTHAAHRHARCPIVVDLQLMDEERVRALEIAHAPPWSPLRANG